MNGDPDDCWLWAVDPRNVLLWIVSQTQTHWSPVLRPHVPRPDEGFWGLGTYLCRSGSSIGRTSSTEGRRSSWLLHTELLQDKPRAGKLRSKTNPEYRVHPYWLGVRFIWPRRWIMRRGSNLEISITSLSWGISNHKVICLCLRGPRFCSYPGDVVFLLSNQGSWILHRKLTHLKKYVYFQGSFKKPYTNFTLVSFIHSLYPFVS